MNNLLKRRNKMNNSKAKRRAYERKIFQIDALKIDIK
jgi:hypothetical protein